MNDDLITVDWLLSVGAFASILSAEPGEDGYRKPVRVIFKGNDWYFEFGGNSEPILAVGGLVDFEKKVPHLTKKTLFRKLYKLLENKKLVE